MILAYHKIDIICPTLWWVTPAALARQLAELANREFVYLDAYDPANPRHVVLTFDDAYENLYWHAFPLLRQAGLPFEIFVIGGAIGGWNHFDTEEPLTRFASLAQLREMAGHGARLQWHSHSHPSLPSLAPAALEEEMRVPVDLRHTFPTPHFRWLAYPFGQHDSRAEQTARQNFAGAVSVNAGDMTDRWRLNRVIVREDSHFFPVPGG
jgi:peptidoglycan/xylan/chitin deacetylase (PgdA/CDA1 family)